MSWTLYGVTVAFLTASFGTAGPDEAAVVASLKKLGDVYVTPRTHKKGIEGLDLRITGEKKPEEVIAALKDLAKLPRLQSLVLIGVAINDETATEIAPLKGLKSLTLFNTEISDKGMAEVAKLQGLRRLIFSGTRLSDEGLKHVARLKDLQYLEIIDAPITNDGLMALATLGQLRRVTVQNSRVTEEGIARLREALPAMQFGRQFRG